MVELLRRSQAPLSDGVWQQIGQLAAERLRGFLSARNFVDVDGPYGWNLSAVNLGRLDFIDQSGPEQVPWGIRKVLPLVEARIPFALNQMELDAIARGCKDPDLEAMEDAVKRAALFEESAIYQGLAGAGIRGVLDSADKSKVPFPESIEELPAAVANAVDLLQSDGIPRPYQLVLGNAPYFRLVQKGQSGYPPQRIIQNMVDGDILVSGAIQEGLLVSGATGHFELTLGQDWSIGYAIHDRENVELYLTETFTFRTLEPGAVVELTSSQ